jgi:prevent-host-death family protein
MQFSIREAREKFSHLLKAVERGEKVEITRRGRVVARLTRVHEQHEEGQTVTTRAAERRELRESLPPTTGSAATLIRELREERG